jgi:hypothetical protein
MPLSIDIEGECRFDKIDTKESPRNHNHRYGSRNITSQERKRPRPKEKDERGR